MAFSLHLVYLGTAAFISEKKKKNWVHVGARIFKGQRSSTNHKIALFVSWRNKYAIIEWPLFDAPTRTHGVFTSFSLPQYCCFPFWQNKVGSMLAQGFLRVKSQAKITQCYFFVSWRYEHDKCAIIEWPPFDAPTSTHGVFTSFSLSKCCCLHFCRNKTLGSCWRRDILRVKGKD